MQKLVAERLPEISPEVSKLLKGSLDFLGINHYTTLYARNDRARIKKLVLNDAYSDSAVITTRKISKVLLLFHLDDESRVLTDDPLFLQLSGVESQLEKRYA